jgi:hypothetical protein
MKNLYTSDNVSVTNPLIVNKNNGGTEKPYE